MDSLVSKSYSFAFEDQSDFILQGTGVTFHNSNSVKFTPNQGLAVVCISSPLDIHNAVSLGSLDLGLCAESLMKEDLLNNLKVSIGFSPTNEKGLLDYSSDSFDLLYFEDSWKVAKSNKHTTSLLDFNFQSNSIGEINRYVYLKLFLNTDLLNDELIVSELSLSCVETRSKEVYFSDLLDSEGRGVPSKASNTPQVFVAGSLGGYQPLKSLVIEEDCQFFLNKVYWRVVGKQDSFQEIELSKKAHCSSCDFQHWLKVVQDTYLDPKFFQKKSEINYLQVKVEFSDGSSEMACCILQTTNQDCLKINLSEDLNNFYYEEISNKINPFSEVSSIELGSGSKITSAKVLKSSNLEVIHKFESLTNLSNLAQEIRDYQVDTGVVFIDNPLNIYLKESLIEELILVIDDSGSALPLPVNANKIVKGVRIKPSKVSLKVRDSATSKLVPHFKFLIKGVKRGVSLGLEASSSECFSYKPSCAHEYMYGDLLDLAPFEDYDITIICEGYLMRTERHHVAYAQQDIEIKIDQINCNIDQKLDESLAEMKNHHTGFKSLKDVILTSIDQNTSLLSDIKHREFGLSSLKNSLNLINEESVGKLDHLLSLINTLDNNDDLISVLNILQDSTIGNEALASKLENIKKLDKPRVSNLKYS